MARPDGQQARRQRLVVGIERRQVRPERHARRAGQRGDGDEVVGRLLVGEADGVGEHEPALGVGIADLHRHAVPARQHVAGAEGVAGDAVLGGGDQHAQAHRQLCRA